MHSKHERHELKKTFSPMQIWALALGCIIGWGAFILPGIRFLPSSGPVAAAIGFFIGGTLLVFVALSYGKMIEHYPVAGGEFAYAYVGFGPKAAFICGWALVLGYMCIIALNATAIALLTRFLMPGVFEWGHLYTIAGWDVQAGELLLVSSVILIFGIINYRGVAIAGKFQLFMAVALVTGIVVFFASALMAPTTEIANLEPFFSPEKGKLVAVAATVAIAPWLFVGFDTVPQASEEMDFPHSMASKLMVIAIIFGAALYALVTLGVGMVIPYPELLAQNSAWATGTIAEMTMGRAGSIILAIAVLSAILTGMNGFYIATSRLIFSMARSQFLPKWFARVHPKHHSPCNAVLFCAGMCLIAPWFGREALNWVVDMSAVGTVIAYWLTSMTAYKLAKNVKMNDSFRSKVYAVTGALASVLCLALLVTPNSPAAISYQSWVALAGWALLGIIFYCTISGGIRGRSISEHNYLILGDENKRVFFNTEKLPTPVSSTPTIMAPQED